MLVSVNTIMKYFFKNNYSIRIFLSVLQLCEMNAAMTLRHNVSRHRKNIPMTSIETHFKIAHLSL